MVKWLPTVAETFQSLKGVLRLVAGGIATALFHEAWTMSDHGEYLVSLVMVVVAVVLSLIAVWGWSGFSEHPRLTKPLKWTLRVVVVCWGVISFFVIWRNMGSKRWSNFTLQDFTTARSYLSILMMISWRWLAVITGIVLAFLVGRWTRPQGEPEELKSAADQRCSARWLHAIANNDRDEIQNAVMISGIHFSNEIEYGKRYVDFAFAIFNESVYEISIDDSIEGDIIFDGEILVTEKRMEKNRAENCRIRGTGTFLIRQYLNTAEINSIKTANPDRPFRLDGLIIKIKGGADFPDVVPKRLRVGSDSLSKADPFWSNYNSPFRVTFETDDTATRGDEWLREIADTQKRSIADYVSAQCWIMDSYLLEEPPFIDFRFVFRSSCVYALSVAGIDGSIRFGNRRLSKPLTITHNFIKKLSIGKAEYLTVTQPLSPEDAVYILNNRNQEFYVNDFSVRLESSPTISDPLSLKLSLVDKTATWEKYPQLHIEIQEVALEGHYDFRKPSSDRLIGSVLSVRLRFDNPRQQAVEIANFKLNTAPQAQRITPAQKGEIREKANISKDEDIPNRRAVLDNLNDGIIQAEQGIPHEGWLQFHLRDIDPRTLVGATPTIVVTATSGEEHPVKCPPLDYKS